MRPRFPAAIVLASVLGLSAAWPISSGVSLGASSLQAPQRGRSQAPPPPPTPAPIVLPNKKDSFKFGVLGDFGTGSKEQYQLAQQMVKLHDTFKYQSVVLVGDNLYGSERPQDFAKKFEIPYKPLLDAGVKFYAALGNHDAREQRSYKLFNMNDQLYYVYKAADDVSFFMLESTYPVPEQIAWVEKELKASNAKWKIPVFHHPLYSSGEFHGSDTKLREVLEPLFVKYGVSIVLTGHDHFYERTKPQKDITYFVAGSGGKLRSGNIDKRTGLTAAGFDTDLAFMAAEITGDQISFNTISRAGKIVDSGVITRRKTP